MPENPEMHVERRRVVPLTHFKGGIYSNVYWSRWRIKAHFRIRSKWDEVFDYELKDSQNFFRKDEILNEMWTPICISYVECQCRIWNISCDHAYDCNLQQIDSISPNPWTCGKFKSSLIENSNVRGVIQCMMEIFTLFSCYSLCANYTVILYYSYGCKAEGVVPFTYFKRRMYWKSC